MMLTKIDEEKVKKIDLTEYVAAPQKILRPCQLCGSIKVAAAVSKTDNDLAVCRNCMLEVSRADIAKHRLSDPLVIGSDWCSICGTRQALSIYSFNGVKYKLCEVCSHHIFSQLNPSPF